MERYKKYYYQAVQALRSLPDPLEISIYFMLGAWITLLIDKIGGIQVDEFGAIFITGITNILTYIRFKIDAEKAKLEIKK